MLEKVVCDLCGGEACDVVYPATVNDEDCPGFQYSCTNDGHGSHYQVVRCQRCGLCYCSPRPRSIDLECGYQEVQDPLYEEEMLGRRRTFQRNLRQLSLHKEKGKLLDIGCYLGVFLDEAKKQGWEVEGLEPSRWCVEQAEKVFGLRLKQGTYRDVLVFHQEFDVVTMWDILEHVDSPMNALRLIHSTLKDDGLFVFSTLDLGSWYARFFGSRWPWLMRMHIYYFDRKHIRQYLEKAGFTVREIKVYKHIVSLEYLVYKLKRINKFLFVLMAGFYKVCRLFKKDVFFTIALGDFMEVYAQKASSVEGGAW